MIFFHGTTVEAWAAIQAEGVLWGGETWLKTGGKEGYRYTYLSPHLEVAQAIGDGTVLKVEYEPVGVGVKVGGQAIDNYGFDPPPGETCWQFSVFVPIPVGRCAIYSKGVADASAIGNG